MLDRMTLKKVKPAGTFEAKLEIVGINPFIFVPAEILNRLFSEAGKDRGHIPICGILNDVSYRQTLVRYRGYWRLYVNTKMLPNSPKRIGETVRATIQFDRADRTIAPHPQLVRALRINKKAKGVFDSLPPSTQKEIVRYISSLKSEESIKRNVERAIGFLLGKNRFIGRDSL